MKTSILLLIFAFSGLLVFSQDIVLKPTVGINFSNFSKNPSDGKYTGQAGYQIGGSVAFGRKFYVEPGIF